MNTDPMNHKEPNMRTAVAVTIGWACLLLAVVVAIKDHQRKAAGENSELEKRVEILWLERGVRLDAAKPPKTPANASEDKPAPSSR